MIFPIVNVAYMPLPPDRCGPGFRRSHCRVIQPNREQHKPILPLLALKTCLDFPPHPRASNGVLRQHDEQFVVQPDCVIDALPEPLAYLKVFGSEPAPNPLDLWNSL